MKKMIKLLSVLLCIALLTCLLTIIASATETTSGSCGTDLRWSLTADGTLTISGTGTMDDYDYDEIPWYSQCNTVKTVVIESDAASIDARVFDICTCLTDVYYNGSATDWLSASRNRLPPAVSLHFTEDGQGKYGSNLTWSLTAQGALTINGIGNMANYDYDQVPWYRCRSAIRSVVIADGVTSVGSHAFDYCKNLTSAVLSDSVTVIGYSAFSNCSALTDLQLPNRLTEIGYAAFYACTSLTHIILPNSVTTIDSATFENCSTLASVQLPAKLKSWYNGSMFSGCSALHSIIIPDGTETIGWGMFSDCVELTDITIPASVKYIYEDAFNNCTNLETIYYASSKLHWGNIQISESGNSALSSAQIEYAIETPPLPEGWNQIDGKWYFIENGVPITNTWCRDSIGWCYLGDDGAMLVNSWASDSNGKCYIGPDGYCVTGTYTIDGVAYYFNAEGNLLREGWNISGGKWYYVENGSLIKNAWRQDSIGWCYLGTDGAMLTHVWIQDSVGLCYIGGDGYCLVGTHVIDGVTYTFDENARLVEDTSSDMSEGWNFVDGKWYYVENGSKVTNQWRRDSIGWCLLGDDGAMLTNQWTTDSDGWCYIGPNGYCVTGTYYVDGAYHNFDSEGNWLGEAGSSSTGMAEGWNLIDGKWYFVENGVKVTNQWRRDSIGWCLLGDDGAMLTNQWTTDSDGWCYIGPDGYCVTGTYYVDGAYHNFDSEGNWLGEA